MRITAPPASAIADSVWTRTVRNLTESYRFRTPSFLNISLGTVAETDVVNVTESGILSDVGIYVRAAPAGAPVCWLQVYIDGQAFQRIQLYNTVANWLEQTRAFAIVGIGAAVDDRMRFIFSQRYETSLRVSLNVTQVGTAGTIDVHVLRGTRL